MVRRVCVKGDRKDYYEAETDCWKIVKGVLTEREKKEFDQALSAVVNGLKKTEDIHKQTKQPGTALVIERLKKLEDFMKTMDKLVSVLLTVEDLKRNFLGITKVK